MSAGEINHADLSMGTTLNTKLDLTLQVAGYNARFVGLHEDLQETIIDRTEHGL